MRFQPVLGGPSTLAPFEAALRVPGESGLMGVLALDAPQTLTARVAPAAILPGPPTLLWSLDTEQGGRVLRNPLLRVRRGARVNVRLDNQLDEETTIHWHGLEVDERNDGSGLHPVRPRASNDYAFTVTNPCATYWYHPHPHYRTGYQVHKGMGSMLLVEDETEDELRRALGLEFGVNEMPLMIQDKQLDGKNQFKYSFGEDDWIGNRVLVNGTPEPRWTAQRRLTRLRLLNASNARPYRLAFMVGERLLPYWLIGTDGGWLEGPLRVTESYLAPAQRLDVLIDLGELDAGTRVRMVSLAFDAMENDGQPMTELHLEHPGATPIGQQIDLMAIDLEGPARRRPNLPTRLNRIVRARDGKPDRVFRLHIDNGRWLINGRNHHDDMERARFEVRRGSREIWELQNDSQSMPHPMHIHAFSFQVLAREGSPRHITRIAHAQGGLTPQDLGWLDTVLVWPGERVRIALNFAQPFQGPQMYMFHCHNLEHEDQGLMLNFRVLDADTPESPLAMDGSGHPSTH